MSENKKTILLVEDDVFMSGLLAREFGDSGFNAIAVKTGEEGIKKFGEVSPNLVILDLRLPDMSGFDALRQIRRAGGAETKVIVLSNLSEDKDREEAERLGVAAYLVKANTALPEIVEKIKEVLAR